MFDNFPAGQIEHLAQGIVVGKVGVEIWLHQSLVRRSWITLIVNPSSLLEGMYCPTALFSDVSKIPEIKHRLREILDSCGIDRRLKEFKLSRVDLTEDRYYPDSTKKDEDLAIFIKSFLISMERYVFRSLSIVSGLCMQEATVTQNLLYQQAGVSKLVFRQWRTG